jgi:Tfp pilus assembly protein PilX
VNENIGCVLLILAAILLVMAMLSIVHARSADRATRRENTLIREEDEKRGAEASHEAAPDQLNPTEAAYVWSNYRVALGLFSAGMSIGFGGMRMLGWVKLPW